jgi:hypothetical protein
MAYTVAFVLPETIDGMILWFPVPEITIPAPGTVSRPADPWPVPWSAIRHVPGHWPSGSRTLAYDSQAQPVTIIGPANLQINFQRESDVTAPSMTPHARAPNIRFCLETRRYPASEEPAQAVLGHGRWLHLVIVVVSLVMGSLELRPPDPPNAPARSRQSAGAPCPVGIRGLPARPG